MPFCSNCGKQNADSHNYCIECGTAYVPISRIVEPMASLNLLPSKETAIALAVPEGVQHLQQPIYFDLAYWFKKNTGAIAGTLAVIPVIILVYSIFNKHDLQTDAKDAVAAYCNCSEKYNDAIIDAREDFISSFSAADFKRRQDARNKLLEMQNHAGVANKACSTSAQANYFELRDRNLTNEELKEFDLAFSSHKVTCHPGNQNKLNLLSSKVESKIVTIKDAEPDIEIIKSDLVGKKIRGWTFKTLSEFSSAKILNTTHGAGRIKYLIDLHITDNRLKDPHDGQIIVTYHQGGDEWLYQDVKEVNYTLTNTASINN